MEPNERLNSYYHQDQRQPPPLPPALSPTTTTATTTTTTTTATPSTFADGGVNVSSSYLQSLAGKAPATVPQRKKRGRPRKYGTPEAAAAAKRAYVPAAIKKKEQHFHGGSSSHSSSSSSQKSDLVSVGGLGFTPHVINVAQGEDVGQKIMLFMQQTKRELCILSASGSIASAYLCQPAMSGGGVAYQGRFDIVSLTGSYVRSDYGGKAGGLSACLCSVDGQIVGGGVGGPLIAAGPVEVIVGTFLIDPKNDPSTGLKADASGSKMPSSVSASTGAYRPVIESSGGFTVTRGDDRHNMDGSPFMMQPMWRSGFDNDLAGNTGHDSHDSPGNGDRE